MSCGKKNCKCGRCRSYNRARSTRIKDQQAIIEKLAEIGPTTAAEINRRLPPRPGTNKERTNRQVGLDLGALERLGRVEKRGYIRDGSRSGSQSWAVVPGRVYAHSKEEIAKAPKRKIDGKIFARAGISPNKQTANMMADKLRNTGHLARVIPLKNGYSIYYRGGRKYNRFNPNEVPPERDIYTLNQHNRIQQGGRSLGIQPQINQRYGLRYDSTIYHVGEPKPMIMTGGIGVPEDQLEQVRADNPDDPPLGWIYPVYAEDLNPNFEQLGGQPAWNAEQQLPNYAVKLARAGVIMNALSEKYGPEQFYATSRQFLPEWTWIADDPNAMRLRQGGELQMRIYMEALADLVQYYIQDDPKNYELLAVMSGSTVGATTPRGYVNAETGEFVQVKDVNMTGDINTYNRKRGRRREPYDRNKKRKQMRREARPSKKRKEVFDLIEEALDDRSHGDEFLAEAAQRADVELRLGILPIDLEIVRKRITQLREENERKYSRPRTYNNPAWLAGQKLPDWAADKDEDGFDDSIE
jgi:hypothetical protein